MTKRIPRDLSGDDVRKALARIGFELSRQKGSHMMLRRGDPATMVVVPAHKVVKPGTLRKIISQAGLTVEEFVDLVG